MKRRFYRWLTQRYLKFGACVVKDGALHQQVTARVAWWDPLFWVWLGWRR